MFQNLPEDLSNLINALPRHPSDLDELPGIWAFPNDDLRDAYLALLPDRPTDEVLTVIEASLIPSTALGQDHLLFEVYLDCLANVDDPEKQEHARRMKGDRHTSRVIAYYSGETEELPREGIRWVASLLPNHPRHALRALDAYFLAHKYSLSDKMIHALGDAEAVIRAAFIGSPTATADRIELLYGELSAREFEQVVENLYNAMGYETKLTPRSGDHGRDVEAHRAERGFRETLFVECKKYAMNRRITSEVVSSLIGRVSTDAATKGALVTTSRFANDAIALADRNHRVELIAGQDLVLLMNEHLGMNWPARLDRYKNRGPFRVSRA